MPREKITRLSAVDPETATGDAKAVLDKARAQVGFVPNMYANMANLPGLLDTYLHGYAVFRENGEFTPPEQETVFLAISHENRCEYCVSAHSMLAANKSGLDDDAIEALRGGETIDDEKLAALDQFTRLMVSTRGNPSRAEVDAFISAGFSEQQVLSIILAISVKTLSNYANHFFNTDVDEVFSAHAWPD